MFGATSFGEAHLFLPFGVAATFCVCHLPYTMPTTDPFHIISVAAIGGGEGHTASITKRVIGQGKTLPYRNTPHQKQNNPPPKALFCRDFL